MGTWIYYVLLTLVGLQGYTSSFLGILLYLLLNWSYTTAVFTDPGSPLWPSTNGAGYSHLPTHEPTSGHQDDLSSFTVKSTGGTRFCKKCQSRKPDRAHHCSTCRRCVLKMDHHCPWLATCVGLRNYKAFVLFLIYTTLFCWLCFVVTCTWVWSEVLSDGQYLENFMPVNYVMLCVIAGIIGLALTGFTGWHIGLACKGQTTIECLEKTRYLSPLRKSMQKQNIGQQNGGARQSFGQQLAAIHANALPGVTREEEGEEWPCSSVDVEQGPHPREALRANYNDRERSRERERYEDYLNEQDSEKLPNAFDLGWKRNLLHLFGDKPALWLLPICNTSGDGWRWEPSPKWLEAREEVRRQREAQWLDQERRESAAGWGNGADFADPRSDDHGYETQRWQPRIDSRHGGSQDLPRFNGAATAPREGKRSPGKADQILGREPDRHYIDNETFRNERPRSGMSMQTIRRKSSFEDERYDSRSDEEPGERTGQRQEGGWYGQRGGGEGAKAEDDWRGWE